MTRFDITAIGEGGLRLSTPPGELLERADVLDVAIAGTEANVLAALSGLGWRSSWASRLPQTPVGRRVERELRTNGVGLELVSHTPDGRVGVYFVEYGAAPRPTSVHFDRKDTAFSQMSVQDVDWDGVLDTRILHLTGITAALSDSTRAVVEEAARRADAAGVAMSFDVNYRTRLWSVKEAATTVVPLIEASDVVFIRQGDGQLFFGTDSADATIEKIRTISDARHIAVTDSTSGAVAWVDGAISRSAAVPVQIVDRLGAGDAFAAGYLDRVLAGDAGRAVDHATALAALCLAQRGEQVVTTRDELARLADEARAEAVNADLTR